MSELLISCGRGQPETWYTAAASRGRRRGPGTFGLRFSERWKTEKSP